MQLFDDSLDNYRWQGDESLPLHNVGYDNRLKQLKEEFSQIERPEATRMRSIRRGTPRLNRGRR